MRRVFARFAVASLLASVPLFAPSFSRAQTAALVEHSARVSNAVSPAETVRLSGHVPVYADASRIPSTAMATNAKFAHLAVMLTRSPDVEAAFQQLLADQVNPSSPRYHQWLTPAEVGSLYGPAQTDVDAVTAWLQSQGLTVNSVSPSRLSIDFGGPVASVERAFSTSFRIFSLANGEERYSLVEEPSVPAALRPVVGAVAGMSEVIHRSNAVHHKVAAAGSAGGGGTSAPDYTVISNGVEYNYLLSGDFNAAYDITSTLNSGITGAGQNIAIIGESRVYAPDITQLEMLEGLTSKQANVIIPTTGTDPGTTADDAQGEATLDVDRTIGTAPGATIDLVVSGDVNGGQTYATAGLFIAINYEISTVNDPIMSISFGGCEALTGQANTNYEASLFATAASQGISTFVSAGDSGAAGCNFNYSNIPATQVLSINDLCSSAYVTCVGGTEFAADVSSPSTYWSRTNSSTFSSLQTYIPEGAWNDPVYASRYGYDESSGTGGGTSVYIARPSWQTGTGVPAGSYRLVPDVSFTASPNHDGFIVCLNYDSAACAYSGTNLTQADVFGGTSADAPSMAAIQALLNQKLGGRQGNVNPTIYSLAAAGTGFHDVTVASSGVSGCVVTTPSLCNNSTPAYASLTGGLSGYLVNVGYDESTGWGSLDVGAFLTVAANTFTINPTSATLTVDSVSGSSVTDSITVKSTNTFAGLVALTCTVTNGSGTAAGTCSLSSTSATLTAGSSGATTLTVNPTAGTSGTLNVSVTGTSGSTVNSSTVTVTVVAPNFTLTPASAAQYLLNTSGSAVTDNIALASVAQFTGTVALSCSVAASGTATGTCTVAPMSATLGAGGAAATTLTVTNTSAGGAGALTVTVTGTSGSLTNTAMVTLTVSAPTFSISPTAGTITLNSNSGSAATDTVAVASVLGFAGAVNLSCATTTGTSCALAPTTATLTAMTSSNSMLTITPVVGFAGTSTVTITGVSGSITKTATVTAMVNAPAVSVTPSPTSLNFTSGATSGNTSTINVQSVNGFSGTVTLTCMLSTSAAHFQPMCVIAPASVSVTTSTAGTAILTISSTTAQSAAEQGQFQARSRWTLGGGAALAMLLVCVPMGKRRRKFAAVTLAVLLIAGSGLLNGCSSSTGGSVPVLESSAGTYTATITATGTTTGATTPSTVTKTVSITIN